MNTFSQNFLYFIIRTHIYENKILKSEGTHTTFDAITSYTYLNTYFIDNPGSVLSGFILRMYHFIFRNVTHYFFHIQ